MLKVVTLIATLRAAESEPGLLRSSVTIADTRVALPTEIQTAYPPNDPIVPGRTYTVNELLEHLIVDSDNSANRALSKILGEERMTKVYEDLQLPSQIQTNTYHVTDYSRVFRALYNGTYLSRTLSEQVLRLLSRTTFTQGLVTGVPDGTVVSHKFGVHYILPREGAAPSARELHDCGIVYYPEHPYFLCVMTRGETFEGLERLLASASEIAWQQTALLH